MLYPVSFTVDAYIQADSLEEAIKESEKLEIEELTLINVRNENVYLEQIELLDLVVLEPH